MLDDNQDNVKKLDDNDLSSEESDDSGTRAIDYTVTYIEIVTPPTKTNGIGLKIGEVGKAEIINHIMGTSQFSIFSDALNGWVDLLLEMFV